MIRHVALTTRLLVPLIGLVFALPAPAAADDNGGGVNGTVVDRAGRPAADVLVRLLERADAAALNGDPADGAPAPVETTHTADDGAFRLNNVAPGRYLLVAGTIRAGLVIEPIVVESGKPLTLTLKLKLGEGLRPLPKPEAPAEMEADADDDEDVAQQLRDERRARDQRMRDRDFDPRDDRRQPVVDDFIGGGGGGMFFDNGDSFNGIGFGGGVGIGGLAFGGLGGGLFGAPVFFVEDEFGRFRPARRDDFERRGLRFRDDDDDEDGFVDDREELDQPRRFRQFGGDDRFYDDDLGTVRTPYNERNYNRPRDQVSPRPRSNINSNRPRTRDNGITIPSRMARPNIRPIGGSGGLPRSMTGGDQQSSSSSSPAKTTTTVRSTAKSGQAR